MLSDRQSDVADMLTPGFFGSALAQGKGAEQTADTIMLALMAGWEVADGVIRQGRVAATMVPAVGSATGWLAHALAKPAARVTLLAPEARVLALGGVLQDAPPVTAVVASTYEFFEPEQAPGARAQQVLERLARTREARGLGETEVIEDTPGIEQIMERVHRSELSTEDAARQAVQTVAARVRLPLRVLIWETHDLDAIEFPPELLARGKLSLSAGATYYRARGGAWGQYVVIFVLLERGTEV